jgi:hypothetical protein
VFKSVQFYDKPESCSVCDEVAIRVIHGVNVSKPHFDHYDSGLGKVITSRNQERLEMKKRGLIDLRETPAYESRKKGQKWQPKKESYDPLGESLSDYVLEGVRQEINTKEKIEKWSKEKKKKQAQKSSLVTA